MNTVQDDVDDKAEDQSLDLRLLWLLVIPGILVAAILTRVFFLHVDDQAPSVATRTLTVSVPAQVGRCAVPTAEQLSQQSTALQATVISVNDATAQLRVTRVLNGPEVGRVTVQLPASGAPGVTEVGVPTFTVGDSYLLAVSASGSLAGCGLSGKAGGDLEDLYNKAFG